VSKTIVHSN